MSPDQPRYIDASHRAVEIRAQARAAETDRILREERERDRRREAERVRARADAGLPPEPAAPPPPPKPKPVRVVRTGPPKAPEQAVPIPSPPPAPVLPPGHVAVPADVLDALLESSPLTKETR